MNIKLGLITIGLLLSFGFLYQSNESLTKKKSKSQEELAAIDLLLNQQVASWNNGSVAGFMEGYWKNDSLRFITRKGVKTGWQTVLHMYQTSYPTKEKLGTLSFEIKERRIIDQQNQMANYVGMYRVDKIENGAAQRDSGYFSLILRKIENKDWKIIIDHTF